HAARSHVGTDRATVTTVLVSTVRLHVAREVVAAHDTGEAAAFGHALHVHELAGLEQLIYLEVRTNLDAGGELAGHAQLSHVLARRHVGFLERARERLVRVLLGALTGTQDDGVVAILLLSALADHADVGLDDRARDDAAVFGEDLGHADLATDDAGELIHCEMTFGKWRGRHPACGWGRIRVTERRQFRKTARFSFQGPAD